MSRQKRCSLSYKVQPTVSSSLGQTAMWLNEMSIENKNQTISHLLVMTCIPLVKADAGANQEELERCYWEFEQWVYHYRFILRQRLNLEGQFNWEQELKRLGTKPMLKIEADEEEEDEIALSNSESIGGGKVKNAGSIFSGFG